MEALSKALRKRLTSGAKLSALLSISLSCGPGDIDDPKALPGDPYCAFVIGSVGHFEDGSVLLIGDWDESRVLGGCVCATLEEIQAGLHDQEMNQRALEECQRFAAMQDFVHDECLEDYEAGGWLSAGVTRCEPGSDCEDVLPPELHCAGTF